MVGIGADLDGDDIEGPRGFNSQREAGSVESLTTYQHPVIRAMMHHDAVVAMHHRSMNTHHGYQQGVGDEPGHYSSELENELSGMARYSGSQRLQTSFPWSGAIKRVSNPPSEDEGVFYHATPTDWTGSVDPKRTRIGPSHEGGAGFYGTDELSVANAYRKHSRMAEEGPAYEYRAPFRGMELFPLPSYNNDDEEVEIEPHIKKRIANWLKDMSKRYLGADAKHLKPWIDNKSHPYTQIELDVDISRLVDAIYTKVGQKASYRNNNSYLHRDLRTHLLTMALIAAGYHGTSRFIPRNIEDTRASHSVFSFFPTSWALLRRTGSIPGAPPDRTTSFDQELPFLDAKPVKKDKIRARQPRDKGIRGRISTANPWR